MIFDELSNFFKCKKSKIVLCFELWVMYNATSLTHN